MLKREYTIWLEVKGGGLNPVGQAGIDGAVNVE